MVAELAELQPLEVDIARPDGPEQMHKRCAVLPLDLMPATRAQGAGDPRILSEEEESTAELELDGGDQRRRAASGALDMQMHPPRRTAPYHGVQD